MPEPRGSAAAFELVAAGRTTEVLEALAAAPEGPTTEPLWRAVGTPEALRAALRAHGIDHAPVRTLIRRLGVAAVDPLLDLLGDSEDHATRAAALARSRRSAPPRPRAPSERLAEAPWYLQRNLLLLLGRVRPWPDDFSPTPWAGYPDAPGAARGDQAAAGSAGAPR